MIEILIILILVLTLISLAVLILFYIQWLNKGKKLYKESLNDLFLPEAMEDAKEQVAKHYKTREK